MQLILGMVEKVDEKVALIEEELLFHEAQGRQQVILVQ